MLVFRFFKQLILFPLGGLLLLTSLGLAEDSNSDGLVDYREDEILLVLSESSTATNETANMKKVQGLLGQLGVGRKALHSRELDRPSRKVKKKFAHRLSQTLLVRLDSKAKLPALCQELKKLPGVLAAEPNYLLKYHALPNDPYATSTGSWGQSYQDQWPLYVTQMPQAWDLETQTHEVIVAVVDSGLDFSHPEIAGRFWLNSGEIAANGIDDDGNGYVDDTQGWDFADSDANPADITGHGTIIAGIIAATSNNNQGMAGLARHAKVMVLRNGAGSSDVADSSEAIRYAADNGAKVINLSFGGDLKSAVLESAVNYAHAQGCVVIASAGNDNTSTGPSYPANFDNVVSVGASDHLDVRSDFSNYGYNVDFLAPGGGNGPAPQSNTILSLKANGTNSGTGVGSYYTRSRGTSFSGPFCAGLAAMMLNERPGLGNEEIRQILRTSCDDIGDEGWDLQTSFGRVNARKALEADFGLAARLLTPAVFTFVGGIVTVKGDAYGNEFDHYLIEYRLASGSGAWQPLASSSVAVTGATLATWDTTLVADGEYMLRLRAVADDNSEFEDLTRITVSNFDPPLYSGWPKSGTAMLQAADIDGDGIKEIIMASGSSVIARRWDQNGNLFSASLGSLSVGPPVVADIDNDGDMEILAIGNDYNNRQGTLRAFTHTGSVISALSRTFTSGNPFISYTISPVVADFDGNGKLEICYTSNTMQFGGKAIIHLIDCDGNELPGWPVTTNTGPVISSPVMGDLDGDGHLEIAFISFDGDVCVLKDTGAMVSGWPKRLGSSQASGSVTLADVDHDGQLEVVVASWGGHFAIYEENGTMMPGWPKTYGGIIRPPALADIDQDGDLEVAIGTQNGLVQLMHHDSTVLPGWPITLPSRAYTPLLCDVDGNGNIDVVAVDGNSTVNAWDAQGSVLYGAGFPISIGSVNGGGPPSIQDVNGDGKMDLLCYGVSIYLFNLNKPATPAAMPYPMMHLNNRNNAMYRKAFHSENVAFPYGIAGQPFQATVTGDFFLKGMSARIGSTAIPVTFQNVNTVKITIPATLGSGWKDLTWIYPPAEPNVYTHALALVESSGDEDGDLLVNSWEVTYGIDPFDDGTLILRNGPKGDPDHDGVVNLWEYAYESLGLNPVVGDSSLLPHVAVSGGVMSLDYPRDLQKNLTLRPLASVDLQNWYGVGEAGAPAGFSDVLLNTVGQLQNRRMEIPMEGLNKVFFKLSIGTE